MNSELNAVNPHYLERAIELGETYEVCASEDIYDANGMKLLAKGARLSAGMQERLIRHKLRKPLETTLSVADGVGVGQVLEAAWQLFDELPPLQACAGEGGSRQLPLDVLGRVTLNNSMTTLLTMAYKSEGQRHFRHTVLVGLIATMIAIRARLPHDAVQAVAHAGVLHDIGEMYLDPAYLKSGAHLKPEEWKYVVVHPKVGQMVLTELTAYPPTVARAVGEHHERLDGSGYPHRCGSKQISREGSIVATAEALGGIFMRPDNPLQRACLALRIIPGEFESEVVSIVSRIAQSVPKTLAPDSLRPLDDQQPRLKVLHEKLQNVLAQCEAIAASPHAKKPAVLDAQQRVADRIEVIKRSLASSGVGACLLEPQRVIDDTRPEILLELEVVSRELEWRLRDIARDLVLHFPQQDDAIRTLFAGLIETLDRLD
ncbi:MAG: HD-GYP domain-containing protein [Gammaproteobacteria bacterium]